MHESDRSLQVVLASLDAARSSAWLLLSDFDNRTFAGHDGYDDEVTHLYKWDSTVPNHSALRAHDVVVLWNKQTLIGASIIDDIEEGFGVKNRYRCPSCGSTKIKRRITKEPEFTCGNQPCRAAFKLPTIEEVGITTYSAEYGINWTPLPGKLSAAECRLLAVRPKSQHSMRMANVDKLRKFLQSISPH
jgi:hypothetical protein